MTTATRIGFTTLLIALGLGVGYGASYMRPELYESTAVVQIEPARVAPSLIDPAVYFGNREVDLAMTQLFGGFNLSFIESYNACFPLVPGFQERVDIYNLYPLLVHVNLFGGGYLSQVKNVLNRYC